MGTAISPNTVGSAPTDVPKKNKFSIEQLKLPASALPLAIEFAAGLVICIGTGQLNSQFSPQWPFTLASGVIICVITFIALCLFLFAKDTYDKVIFEMKGEVTIGFCIAAFLFVWFCISAGIITFAGPFVRQPQGDVFQANGYFATWIGFMASVVGLGSTGAKMIEGAVSAGPMIGLAAAALVLICATPGTLGKAHNGEAIFALVIACITLPIALLFLFLHMRQDDGQKRVELFVLIGLSVIWFVMACVVTFRGPFLSISNGYFASWGGVIAAIFAANAAHKSGYEAVGNAPAQAPATAEGDPA